MKVFFIGAGASKGTFHSTDTLVPVAAEFSKALQDINPQWPSHYPALFKIVGHLDLPLANWGLEPVWTCMDYYAKLQKAIPNSLPWTGEHPSRQMKKALLEVYGKRCDDAADQLPLTDSYTLGQLIKNELNPGDIIISFNYDTIVERLAHRLGGHTLLSVYAQEQNRKKGITLVKPHGSTSWTLDLNRIINGSHQCVISVGEHGEVLLDSLESTDVDNCREPLVLGAVPIKSELIREVQVQLHDGSRPVFDTIIRQWRTVVEAIRDADSVVVVGYSFPQEDRYGRFLLKEGIRLRSSELTVEFFELEDKKPEREEAIRDVFGSCVKNLVYRGAVEAY